MVTKLFSYLSTQTAKDTYWVFGANVFTSFLALIYTLFLAKVFGPSDFGILSTLLAFSLLIADIADFGISTSLTRFLPQFFNQRKTNQANSFIKTSFLFQLVVGLIFCGLLAVFSQYIGKIILKDDNSAYLILFSIFGALGLLLLSFTNSVLAAQKKFKLVAILNILSTMTKLFLIIILFFSKKLILTTAIFIFMISSFVAYFFSFRFLPLNFLFSKENWGNLKKLLSYSSFIAFSRLCSAVASRLDALMIIPLSSKYEAGIYSAAYKVAYLYILLSSSFSQVIAPRLAGFSHRNEVIPYLKKICMAVIGILISMIFMFFMAPYLFFILGEKYVDSTSVFRALLIPMSFFVMTILPVNFLLYFLKKPQVSALNTFIQLFIIIFANSFFIPRYGRFGPVITLSIVYGFTFISATFFSFYFFRQIKDEK